MIWKGGFAGQGNLPSFTLPRALPPQVGVKSRKVSVRKVIWEHVNGIVMPAHYCAWSSCGDHRCVSPTHLRATTKREMLVLMARQGRFKRGQAWVQKSASVSQSRSPLTWDDVRAIRAEMDKIPALRFSFQAKATVNPSGSIGRLERMRQLADQYGVSLSSIKAIVSGDRWSVEPVADNPFMQLLRLAA